MELLDIDTPHGPARVHVELGDSPRAALLLGHGAGGGVGAPDLVAVAEVAGSLGIAVGLVEQPYRVAGRRSAAPAHQLDAAWIAVVRTLGGGPFDGLPLIAGGRSSGARVACRTAAAVGAIGVLCLAFPLIPPLRKSGTRGPSRIDELEAVEVPVLVVQGTNDRFGMPPAAAGREIVPVRGDHGLKSDVAAVRDAARGWLQEIVKP